MALSSSEVSPITPSLPWSIIFVDEMGVRVADAQRIYARSKAGTKAAERREHSRYGRESPKTPHTQHCLGGMPSTSVDAACTIKGPGDICMYNR